MNKLTWPKVFSRNHCVFGPISCTSPMFKHIQNPVFCGQMHTKASNEYTLHKYMFVFMILVAKRNMEIGTKLYPQRTRAGGKGWQKQVHGRCLSYPPPPTSYEKSLTPWIQCHIASGYAKEEEQISLARVLAKVNSISYRLGEFLHFIPGGDVGVGESGQNCQNFVDNIQ